MAEQVNPGNSVKLGLVSLGCAKNLVDSEVMLGILQQRGFTITNQPAEADVIVVNTCTFIEAASRESVDTLLEMAEYKRTGRCRALILAGCMAARYKDQLLAELPEVDAVIGTGEVAQIAAVVERALGGERFLHIGAPRFLYDEHTPRVRATASHTAYVKIAEGCDHGCAFCVIPRVRGGYRSRPMDSIAAEVRSLVAEGVKEVVLIAQDTTNYGCDVYGSPRLAELLDRLADVQGLHWLRVLYTYPTNLGADCLSVIAARPNICKYVELPLQHVSDPVLKAMRRKGDRAFISDLVDQVREQIPGVTLRTSFIVGFPGETDDDFAALCEFVQEKRFDHVGVFTYSQEEGTLAANLTGQVPEAVKLARRQQVMEIQRGISRAKNEALVGSTVEVLVEKATAGGLVGRTSRQAPEIDGHTYVQAKGFRPGDLVRCHIVGARDYDLVAEVATAAG